MYVRCRCSKQRALLKWRTVCGNQETYFLRSSSSFIPPQLFTNRRETSVCSKSCEAGTCAFRFSNLVRSGINVLSIGENRSGTLVPFTHGRGIYYAERDRRSYRAVSGIIGWASYLIKVIGELIVVIILITFNYQFTNTIKTKQRLFKQFR